MLISPPEVISIIFAVITAIMMAIPILKRKRISISTVNMDADARVSMATDFHNAPHLQQNLEGFNKELWEAFEEQRLFTSLGLLALMFSILFQILS